MPVDRNHLNRRRLLQGALAAGVTTIAAPLLGRNYQQAFAAAPPKYSARAQKIVERSLVIDMLAPLKLDFEPKAYAQPLSAQEASAFRSSGITGFHNSVGLGGPTAYQDALTFLAAWQGFAGRNADVFSLVGRASDLDHAKQQTEQVKVGPAVERH